MFWLIAAGLVAVFLLAVWLGRRGDKYYDG